MAWMRRMRAMASVLLGCEHQRFGEFGICGLAGFGEGDGILHSLEDVRFNRVQVRRGGGAGRGELGTEPGDGIVAAPGVDFLLVPVPAAAEHDRLELEMALDAVGARLDERRATAVAGTAD